MTKYTINNLRDYLSHKPHVAIGIPALLCFLSFITNLIAALSDGVIDSNELHKLLSTADGFEAVVLGLVSIALKEKDGDK